ncbi:hypothetical protein [Bradyrhizobium sp. CCBAU 45389]|uniref:hypothetical protein n=1 Tax=Bradyrhizobium sp. CCBAU 45389 TaxID=858429 RepID=UPI0023069045|nr:hypothetical protein [Bradyrhizobium sp. CCBAU 45389]
MAKPAKRIGRPTKRAVGQERVALGLKVTAKTKRIIDQLAIASGRTQSQEAEFQIERALQFDRTLESMATTLVDMERQSVDAVLFRLGYTPIRHMHEGKAWKLWAEPGFPGVQGSAFVS